MGADCTHSWGSVTVAAVPSGEHRDTIHENTTVDSTANALIGRDLSNSAPATHPMLAGPVLLLRGGYETAEAQVDGLRWRRGAEYLHAFRVSPCTFFDRAVELPDSGERHRVTRA